MNPRKSSVRPAAFVLMEAMLAVAIFAIGVLTLGRCVSNCLAAEQFKVEDARARRALENRVAEIEAGAVPLNKSLTEKLTGEFAGLELQQAARPLKMKNEKGEDLTGLLAVTLQVTWRVSGEARSRELIFYVPSRES